MKAITENPLYTLAFVVLMLVGAVIFVLSGESNEAHANQTERVVMKYFDGNMGIYTICEDRTVCYWSDVYNGESISCFRDTDLVEKYCGGN